MKMLKGLIIFTLLLLGSVLFLISWAERSSAQHSNSEKLLLLIPDQAQLTNPNVVVWTNALKESGYPYIVLHDSEYLNQQWNDSLNPIGIILPDTTHRIITPAILGELKKYLQAGGKLFTVYDAATVDIHDDYFLDESPFSQFLGINYGLYDQLKTGMVQYDFVGNTSTKLLDLGIPYGKYISIDEQNGKKTYNSSHGNDMAWITTYHYGKVKYPHYVTTGLPSHGGKYPGQILLTSQKQQLVAGINSYQAGKILFANLPLGYLCRRTDCLLQQVFLQYFAEQMCALPQLAKVPNGVGGLVMNIHVDSTASLDLIPVGFTRSALMHPFAELQKIDLFEQGPYSIHFTAGPNVDYVGDHLGLDVEHNSRIQQWITYLYNKHNSIGNHGGWIHNYFGEYANSHNGQQFEKYLVLNNQAMQQAIGQKIREYAAPEGNQPEWATAWLEKNNFLAYYTPGNTGAAPTRSFVNGEFKFQHIWSFPILTLDKAATFEEFFSNRFPRKLVEDWLSESTYFVANQHTVRLIYFHPHGLFEYGQVINDWMVALKEWLATAKKLHAQGQFRWYTMTEIANFLNNREQINWHVSRYNNKKIITAMHSTSLKDQAWLMLKNNCSKPTVLIGKANLTEQGHYWIISAGDVKKIQFTCMVQ